MVIQEQDYFGKPTGTQVVIISPEMAKGRIIRKKHET